MAQLVPENATRKLDTLGRITLPKGLRDRMFLEVNDELELFTANIDGRNCICMARPVSEKDEIETAINFLLDKGYEVVKNG